VTEHAATLLTAGERADEAGGVDLDLLTVALAEGPPGRAV
jgi:hypothetical protein